MKKRILIVEDDPDILNIIDYLFIASGYTTITSADGEGIIALVEDSHPNVVLMDIRLGKHDGRVLCEELRNHHSVVPIVLMSAHCTRSEILASSRANDFIAKPFDIEDLVLKVEHNLLTNPE